MKRYAVMMLVAFMLFASVPGFAAGPNPIDPGSLNGTSDILVGGFDFGISACCSGDVVSLDLRQSGDFDWETFSDVDGMFIRTIENSGNISGSFDVFNIDSVDITYDVYSEDFFGFDVDSLNQNVSFDDHGFSSVPTSLDISWDFSDIGSSRFVFKQILATISSDEYGFGVGALRIDETPTYTIAVIARETDREDFGPESRILGVRDISDLSGNLSFTYTEDEEDLTVMVILQNWSQNEIRISKSFDTPVETFNLLVDDLNGLSDPQDFMVSFPFFPLNVANSTNVGSATSFGFMPLASEDYLTIGNLNGNININFSSPDATLGINLQEEGSNTGGSSGGCALGFLTPIALLLIAPLLVLLKK